MLIKQNYFMSLQITTLHCIALAYFDLSKPAELGNHLQKRLYYTSQPSIEPIPQLKLDETSNLGLFAESF